MKTVKTECEGSHTSTDFSNHPTNTNTFECQLHLFSSFENLNSFRNSDSLCDITIKVGSHLFRAHKVVLSSASPYFHAMFASDLREKSADIVELYDVDPDSVSNLIDFIYTSKIEILEENVQHLLPASNLLQLTTVRDACCNFLKEQLDPSNALGILLFGDTHGCKDLVETAEAYVLKNFVSVSGTDEFLSLNFEKLKQLLSSDFLMTDEESQVYLALINWIKHDVLKRKEYIGQLLALIRVPLMPKDFLMLTVEPEDLIKCNTHCKDILIEAMKYHLMPEMRRYLQTNRTQPRSCGKTVPVLFVIGGQSLFAIHCECEMYNTAKDAWEAIPQMSVKRARLGVGVIYDKIYAIGGFDGSADLSSMEVLSTKTQVWSSSLPMGTARSCLAVAVLHNLLYAIGGYDGSSCLNTVERYDPLSNHWVSVAKMNARRRYVSIGVINEHIIAAGGYDGSYHLDSCEVYDPVANIWTQKASMKTQRSSAGGCVLNGSFYVSGGTDGSIIVISVERYNITTDQWTSIHPMSNVRMTHSMVVFNNKLVVIGGNDGTTSLNSVEVYDEEEDLWKYYTPMNTRRSHVATATMVYL